MPDLPPPVMVSPLIKFFRYSFLVSGVLYGFLKHHAFTALEAGRADEKARKRADRDAILIEEKRLAAVRDFNQIVEIFSPPPKVESARDIVTDYNPALQGLSNEIRDLNYAKVYESDDNSAPVTKGDMPKADDYPPASSLTTTPVFEADSLKTEDSSLPTNQFYDQPRDFSGDEFTKSQGQEGGGVGELEKNDTDDRINVELPDNILEDSGYIIKDFGKIPVMPDSEESRFPPKN